MAAPRIAIVEDDATVLDMIAECLLIEGYRPILYRQGAGAYEFIEQDRPDAVILDIRMEHPRAGMAVLQRLRRNPATAEIPVLICTADVSFTRQWGRTLAAHRSSVVTKPFVIDELLAALARLIEPSLDDHAPTRGGDSCAKRDAESIIRPVVGLVDTDGKGVTSHTTHLEQKGYKVVACRWGNGLFDMAVREQPDILIVDPGDWPRAAVSYALRRLGRDPLTGHIPVVLDPPPGSEFFAQIEEIAGLGVSVKPAAREM